MSGNKKSEITEICYLFKYVESRIIIFFNISNHFDRYGMNSGVETIDSCSGLRHIKVGGPVGEIFRQQTLMK